jgi:hypothetical protein
MGRRRSGCALGVGLSLFWTLQTSCLQELDPKAASATASSPDAGGLQTSIGVPTIGLDPNDDTATTDDPCVKTANDAHHVLATYCAKCHDQGASSQGVPRFDFLLDDQALINNIWTVGGEQRRFVVPGDPDHSWIYLRPLYGTMPPPSTDLRNPANPAPTLSDLSVLRDWIASCAGGPKMMPMPDAGMADSGIEVDNARFNFEAGAQGWVSLPPGQGRDAFAKVATSTVERYAGISSLGCTITSTEAGMYFAEVPQQLNPPAGTRITFHIFIPSDASVSLVQPYVANATTLEGSSWTYPSTGMWNTLTVVVSGMVQPITRLGVEFKSDRPYSGVVYLDSISW